MKTPAMTADQWWLHVQAQNQDRKRERQEFAENLRLFVEHAGLNGYQLAQAMGINRGQVYKYLNGQKLPSPKRMAWLSDFFGWEYDP